MIGTGMGLLGMIGMAIGGVFGGIEDAKATEGGNYLPAGIYDIELVRITVGKTRKGVPFMAVDMRILGSSCPDVVKIGSVWNWFNGFDKEPALGNAKAFAFAVLSCSGKVDEADITEEVMDEMCADGGIGVAGTKLKVQTTVVKTKAKTDFTKHQWYPAGAAA